MVCALTNMWRTLVSVIIYSPLILVDQLLCSAFAAGPQKIGADLIGWKVGVKGYQ